MFSDLSDLQLQILAQQLHQDGFRPSSDPDHLSHEYPAEMTLLRDGSIDEIIRRGIKPNPWLFGLLEGLIALRSSPPLTEAEKAAAREILDRHMAGIEAVLHKDAGGSTH